MGDRYLTTDEIAERFRTTPATVRYWRWSGYGPKSIKVGRRALYRESDVETFENEQRAAADARTSI